MASVYRVTLLEDSLKRLVHTSTHILGAVMVSVEGFVVATYTRPGDTTTNTPQIAAMSATLYTLGEQTLLRLAQGEIERLLVEGKTGAIMLYPVNQDAVLAVMVNKYTKMGVTLLTVSRTAQELALILN